MKQKRLTKDEKANRVTAQRISMALILCNVLDADSGVSDGIKGAVASSLINMMNDSFIPKDDEKLANLINNSIDNFCAEMEEKTGSENYREEVLMVQISKAKRMLNEVNAHIEKIKRIKEGENILNNICLN